MNDEQDTLREDVEVAYEAEEPAEKVECPKCGHKFSASNVGGASVGGGGAG